MSVKNITVVWHYRMEGGERKGEGGKFCRSVMTSSSSFQKGTLSYTFDVTDDQSWNSEKRDLWAYLDAISYRSLLALYFNLNQVNQVKSVIEIFFPGFFPSCLDIRARVMMAIDLN